MKILACDLSLNCAGFAVLEIDDRGISIVDTTHVDNSKVDKKEFCDRVLGKKLQNIARMMHYLITNFRPDFIVREKAFSRFNTATQVIFRVVGISDLIVYDMLETNIEEISATAVKNIVTGDGHSEKEEVARFVAKYVGERLYATNDESDAVAVGVAWAISKGYIDAIETKKKKKRRGKHFIAGRYWNIFKRR